MFMFSFKISFKFFLKGPINNKLTFIQVLACRRDDVSMTIAMTSQITSLAIVLLNHLFRRRPKKTSKLRVTGIC